MINHIPVPEELLERVIAITQPIAPSITTELRALLDGPGVEPVATLVEPPLDSMKDDFWMTEEDATRLSKLPYGTTLYLAAPPTPTQAIPDGWQLVPKEPTKEMLRSMRRQRGYEMQEQRMYSEAIAAAPQPDEENKE